MPQLSFMDALCKLPYIQRFSEWNAGGGVSVEPESKCSNPLQPSRKLLCARSWAVISPIIDTAVTFYPTGSRSTSDSLGETKESETHSKGEVSH